MGYCVGLWLWVVWFIDCSLGLFGLVPPSFLFGYAERSSCLCYVQLLVYALRQQQSNYGLK
jgi:hypothetical protein